VLKAAGFVPITDGARGIASSTEAHLWPSTFDIESRRQSSAHWLVGDVDEIAG
jgi:hypothetical protein